jgi:hypothetical protein
MEMLSCWTRLWRMSLANMICPATETISSCSGIESNFYSSSSYYSYQPFHNLSTPPSILHFFCIRKSWRGSGAVITKDSNYIIQDFPEDENGQANDFRQRAVVAVVAV